MKSLIAGKVKATEEEEKLSRELIVHDIEDLNS